jgi:hypothetical protein
MSKNGPFALALATLAVFFSLSLCSIAQDSPAQVQLDVKRAVPRAVENLTERAIVRDYKSALSSMAHALEFNTVDPIEQSFAGDARQVLKATVINQQKSGLRQRYVNQTHKLEAVFYAPEGDVIELHDTADCQRQLLDGEKVIQKEHATLHYVVLMTPSANRWVVRQLQAVAQF